MVRSEFLDLNHTSNPMVPVSLVIAKFARGVRIECWRTSQSGHQAQVVTAYDADVARVKQVCQEVGARTADGPESVIGADDVDAVLIAAPDPLHQDLVMSCIAAGKRVLWARASRGRPSSTACRLDPRQATYEPPRPH